MLMVDSFEVLTRIGFTDTMPLSSRTVATSFDTRASKLQQGHSPLHGTIRIVSLLAEYFAESREMYHRCAKYFLLAHDRT
jgi:hypothetical protein